MPAAHIMRRHPLKTTTLFSQLPKERYTERSMLSMARSNGFAGYSAAGANLPKKAGN
jgi:hypothetical protein